MSDAWSRTRRRGRRAGRWLFGDRLGLALFLGTLWFSLLAWQTGILINDNVTLRAALGALADGHVWIEPATGNYLQTPGTGVRDGYVYGRNYGQLVFSLPALWGLQAVSALANLRVALVALWHLLGLAFLLQVGRLLGYRDWAAYGGSALVVASFLANLALVTTFSPSLELLALELTAAVAAAFSVVLFYRLVARLQNRRFGLLAGAGVALATPLGFWAIVPKRHVFTVLFTAGILYAFARSRTRDGYVSLPGVGPVPAFRAAAYAVVGLATWVHAEEGVYLFLALALVDIPTAPSNDWRSLAAVATAFLLSLVPFFVTNLLVSGELLKPPRAVFSQLFDLSSGAGGTAGSGGGGGGGGGGSAGGGPSLIEVGIGLLPDQVAWAAGNVYASISGGINGMLDFENMYRTFVRSSATAVREDVGFRGVNLSILEAAPVLAGLVASAVYAVSSRLQNRLDGVSATDVLALVLIVAFVLTKAGKLPLRVQITVRYFLPLYPLGVFLFVRSTAGRRLLDGSRAVLYWAYAVGVCVGGQLLLLVVVLGEFAVGEAARLHALLGFGLGIAVALACLGALADRRLRPAALALLGLAAAAATVFVLLAGVYYFSFTGEYVLPVVDLLADRLAAVG